MDKLTRYLIVGSILIVVGVVLLALASSSFTWPTSESFAILGVVGLVLGFVMVISALMIDLTQLNRERARQSGLPRP